MKSKDSGVGLDHEAMAALLEADLEGKRKVREAGEGALVGGECIRRVGYPPPPPANRPIAQHLPTPGRLLAVLGGRSAARSLDWPACPDELFALFCVFFVAVTFAAVVGLELELRLDGEEAAQRARGRHLLRGVDDVFDAAHRDEQVGGGAGRGEARRCDATRCDAMRCIGVDWAGLGWF